MKVNAQKALKALRERLAYQPKTFTLANYDDTMHVLTELQALLDEPIAEEIAAVASIMKALKDDGLIVSRQK